MRPLVTIERLRVQYAPPSRLGRALGRRGGTQAVRDVSLTISRGEAFGLVGESGSGKSTLARAILRLAPVAGGRILFDGADIAGLRGADLLAFRRRAQMIFQDPYGSLNPRMTVRATLEEVLAVHPREDAPRLAELLEMVGLTRDLLDRRPAGLSGGQCQRVGIARALAVAPDLLIADEAIAALDVSIQAQIINLLKELRARLGLSILFITHNLAVVRHICDRVAVMSAGEIVETGAAQEVMRAPRHPYTQTLLQAMPRLAGQRP